MLYNLKILILNGVPVLLLVVVVSASFKLVMTDDIAKPATELTDSYPFIETPVQPQAVMIQANSPAEAVASADSGSGQARVELGLSEELQRTEEDSQETQTPATKEQVWEEITQAISGLNELIGAEMFIDVIRSQNGQMEITVDGNLWERVRYQTRVNLKSDISALWHLYVKQYDPAVRSVVYFKDDSNDKVIDIFSKAQ